MEHDLEKKYLLSIIKRLIILVFILIFSIVMLPIIFYYSIQPEKIVPQIPPMWQFEIDSSTIKNYWIPASIDNIQDEKEKSIINYGKELIEHTSIYFGPKGLLSNSSNGMNCQNCHLKAGTAIFGNNYGSVNSLYPKFRARSGSKENLFKRVNDCFERSLNGKSIDTNGNEMIAMTSYINYIGSNLPKGTKAEGSGLKDILYLNRPANPRLGKISYLIKCQSCHQSNGEGILNLDKTEYTYPPLWGIHSYNDGAGLYRVSNLAKFIKYNMPQGATHESPILTDEESWDIAAYVNSQPRPHKNVPTDWPDISKKPIDHPFGPYNDSFSQFQHKFGPYKSIIEFYKKNK